MPRADQEEQAGTATARADRKPFKLPATSSQPTRRRPLDLRPAVRASFQMGRTTVDAGPKACRWPLADAIPIYDFRFCGLRWSMVARGARFIARAVLRSDENGPQCLISY